MDTERHLDPRDCKRVGRQCFAEAIVGRIHKELVDTVDHIVIDTVGLVIAGKSVNDVFLSRLVVEPIDGVESEADSGILRADLRQS